MNYNEGEVACYPPSGEFENDLGMVGLGMGLPCFMENDFSLMEPSTTMLETIPSTMSPEEATTTHSLEVPQIQLATQPVAIPSPLSSPITPATIPLRSAQNLVLTKPGILAQPPTPVACYPPAITFPFVPFWTGCPLPFDPRTYPQPVVPPSPLLTEIMSTSKEEKISKYRQKRLKRNFNRPVDHQRSQMAEKRPRDEKGKFQEAASPSSMGKRVEQSLRAQVDELKERLALSESESRALKEKLAYMEQELRLLKLTTLQCTEQENKPSSPDRQKLSGSPPSSYGFSSTNVQCYTEKIDFSKIELRKTDSPHLEAVRKIEPINDLLPPPTL
eukprot:TRINITY_DN2286_c0_g1_i1.p1 TRINITY_DN2286_c0_g1~~TRINITY_DN2286_c0_g1_i1.p1  ORF type:complete len:331 (-),score=62.02 TRINITY_DN2286_c0_g1_i1:611-1603(-)